MRNFTAIGDTTNVAARLEVAAEAGEVLVNETTVPCSAKAPCWRTSVGTDARWSSLMSVLGRRFGDRVSRLGAPVRGGSIAAHLDRLEAGLAQTPVAVDSLRNLLQRPPQAMSVTHRTVPPTPAVGIQQLVDREDVLSWWQGALGEPHATVHALGLSQTGPSGGLYRE
jgi:hypothetical protein